MAKTKKTSSVGLYYVQGSINRGRADERKPGDLFVPHEDDVDLLLENEIIREATDAEIALWEKTHGAEESGEGDDGDDSDAKAPAAPAGKQAAKPAAPASENLA